MSQLIIQPLATKERMSRHDLQNHLFDLRWIQEPLMMLGKSLMKRHKLSEHDWLDVLVVLINVYLLVKLYGHLRSTASLTHFK